MENQKIWPFSTNTKIERKKIKNLLTVSFSYKPYSQILKWEKRCQFFLFDKLDKIERLTFIYRDDNVYKCFKQQQ